MKTRLRSTNGQDRLESQNIYNRYTIYASKVNKVRTTTVIHDHSPTFFSHIYK